MTRHKSVAVALLALFISACGSIAGAFAQSEGSLVEERSSNYNNLYVYKDGPLYSLTFGHNKRLYTETIFDTRDELALPVTYTRFMTVGLAYAAERKRMLEIGSGGGRTAWYLHKQLPDSSVVTVELDPAVNEVAQKYFGLREENNLKIEIADGRRYLSKTGGSWDMIFVDAYRGPFVPFHLLTREFFTLVDAKLNPGGVLVQNIEPTTMVFEAAIATIRTVFTNVDIYNAGGNIVAVAYQGREKTSAELLNQASQLQAQYKLRYLLSEMLETRRIVNKDFPSKPLTDDFAPVEALLAIERHNRKLDAFTKEPAK